VTCDEHGLQAGEKSAATWDDQTGVEQFSIVLLRNCFLSRAQIFFDFLT
jgi:hypothetical protein